MTLHPDRNRSLIRGWPFTSAAGGIPGTVALIAFMTLGGCSHVPIDTPAVQLDFPSPLSGPGAPSLDRVAGDQINNGYQALERGDVAAARTAATAAGDGPASRLLSLQAKMTDGAKKAISGLEDLTKSQPTYAAAWVTLSVAAERSKNELLALESAATGVELWPNQRWIERAGDLQTLWVDNRVAAAAELFETKQLDEALAALAPARSADPEDRNAVLLESEILIALGDLDRAEIVLSSLPRDAEVVLLAGSLAEARGDLNAAMRIYASLPDHPEAILKAIAIAEAEDDWQSAMNLYSSLPDDIPEKAIGLRRAQLRWRISVMPAYVQEAVDSKRLNRAELAIVLVTLAPKVETLPGGQVPLLSDIMKQPAQREILTAVRHGLVDSDRLEHRYHPDRPVSATDVQYSITTLASLLSLDGFTWCTGEDEANCVTIEEPIAGEDVADIVINLVAREDS